MAHCEIIASCPLCATCLPPIFCMCTYVCARAKNKKLQKKSSNRHHHDGGLLWQVEKMNASPWECHRCKCRAVICLPGIDLVVENTNKALYHGYFYSMILCGVFSLLLFMFCYGRECCSVYVKLARHTRALLETLKQVWSCSNLS